MRWMGLFALAAACTLALEATAQVRQERSTAAVVGTAGLQTAAAPAGPASHAPLATPEPLPPGVRTPEQRASLLLSDGPVRHVSERIALPAPAVGAPQWREIEFTADPTLDERVRSLLDDDAIRLAHVIVMDPDSGEVFSYVSTDPEDFPPDRVYPTASLMKIVTSAAALRSAPETIHAECRYDGSPYRLRPGDLMLPVSGGHVASFTRALAISNNKCFARLAVQQVGAQPLLAEMQRVGLLDPPAARHPAGSVEPIDGALDLGYLGSGLGGSFVTPLGAARLAAVLADGKLVQPYWIARVSDSWGDPLAVPGRRAPQRVWTRALADELRDALVEVTEHGTARRAFVAADGTPRLGPIRVAGKTGTLSGTHPTGRYEWFIGVAPAEAPSIAIAAVVVDGPRRGGNASYVAAETLEEIFCDEDGCDPSGAERLRRRSAERTAEIHRERSAELARDAPPRPLDAPPFHFPRELLRRKVDGEIVVLVTLDAQGEVVDAEVESSDLPEFDEHVLDAVRTWRFTPPTRRGRPVTRTARLPIPIHVE